MLMFMGGAGKRVEPAILKYNSFFEAVQHGLMLPCIIFYGPPATLSAAQHGLMHYNF